MSEAAPTRSPVATSVATNLVPEADQPGLAGLVSVIVPCRNERGHIKAFCQSVAEQQLPEGWRMEVLIADGQSDDGTRPLIQGWAERDARFVMVDNPGRIVSCGLNRCIARSQGEFIVRLDVHTVYATDYIAQCIATWQRTGADNVGGPWQAKAAEGQSPTVQAVQQAVAAAFQSRLVSGGALSRDLAYEGEADTVYLGAWPRQTFARFGGFDEQLVRNQDDEHNLRIHRGGGRIWQSAGIRSIYCPRAKVGDVFRQYRQYGYWKPFVMRKHGQAAALRHLIPSLFVGSAVLTLAMLVLGSVGIVLLPSLHALKWPAIWLTLLGTVGLGTLTFLYAAAVAWMCRRIAADTPGLSAWRHLPDVIAAYHVGYGLGSLRGWWDVLLRRQPDPAYGRLTR
jgi:glycosyltransferase involved in cell wall biosynthesis